MQYQYFYLAPEIFLFLSSCIALFLKKKEFFVFLIFLITAGLSIYLKFYDYLPESAYILNNLVLITPFTQGIKIIILVFSIIFLLQLLAIKNNYDRQLPTLILFPTLGMMLTVSSSTLLSLYLALELQALPLYVLATIDKNSVKSAEAGVKYFILGSLASAIMIYGISLVFIATGSIYFTEILNTPITSVSFIGLMLIISGLLFKLAIFPFHAWAPDIYEGSPLIITNYFATIPKISIVAFLILVFSGYFNASWLYIPNLTFINVITFELLAQKSLLIIGILSLFIGSLCAIKQTDIKRFVAYSGIVNMGYVLLGIVTSLETSLKNPALLYIIIYSLINFGIFSLVLMFSNHKIENLAGFAKNKPIEAFLFTLLLLASAGIPPLSGFFIKLNIIKSLVDNNFIITALLALIAGVITAFYYIKLIKLMYFDPPSASTITIPKDNFLLRFISVLSALSNTVLFIYLL